MKQLRVARPLRRLVLACCGLSCCVSLWRAPSSASAERAAPTYAPSTALEGEGDGLGVYVEITGLAHAQGAPPLGTLYCSLFAQEEGFPAQAARAAQGLTIKVTGPRATCHFPISTPGRYAVSAWHDVNDDHTLNKNWLGVPQEPIGISNNARGLLGPPSFSEASFLHNSPRTRIVIHLS
ncbi:MAG: DUF2141 domain-containing protein [Deltaproteobacteria bacterium]|nr:DUF2141 domain-containing protein [Deltaproteobacteria bacterium]